MNRRFDKHHIVGSDMRLFPPTTYRRRRRARRKSHLLLLAGFGLLAALALAGLLIG